MHYFRSVDINTHSTYAFSESISPSIQNQWSTNPYSIHYVDSSGIPHGHSAKDIIILHSRSYTEKGDVLKTTNNTLKQGTEKRQRIR